MGIDFNDDEVGYNRFNFNGSMNTPVVWSDINPHIANDLTNFDGVCAQSISAVLAPELSYYRFPSPSATKTGLYSRVTSLTITTNASGNAIVLIFPDLINSTAGFPSLTNIYNDTTVNVNTGT